MRKWILFFGVVIALAAVLATSCATAGRPAEEVFVEHHRMVETLGPEDAGLIAADYAEDAVAIMGDGTTWLAGRLSRPVLKGFLAVFPT